MKKVVFHCLSFLMFFSSAFSQNSAYTVIDIQTIRGKPGIAIARDEMGRTVAFRLSPLPGKFTHGKSFPKTAAAIKMGSEILVDLTTSTAAIKSDSSVAYALNPPTSSRSIGTVSMVSPYMASLSTYGLDAYVRVKLINGKDASFLVVPFVPSEEDFWNKPVYENIYDKKKYAIMLPIKAEEMNKIVFSFELQEDEISNADDSLPGIDTSTEQVQKLMEKRPWEIKADPSLKGTGGEIKLELPRGITYSTHMLFYNSGDTKKQVASWFGNNKTKLPAGLYDINVDHKYTLYKVPVEEGKITRLKMGFLSVNRYGPVTISNGSDQKFTYAAPFTILLPEGTYFLPGEKLHLISIKDGRELQL